MKLVSPFFHAIFHLYKLTNFYYLVFLNIIMYTLNIIKAIKKVSVTDMFIFIYESYIFENFEIFTFENYYKGIEFSKESNYYSIKYVKRKGLSLIANKLIEKNILSL